MSIGRREHLHDVDGLSTGRQMDVARCYKMFISYWFSLAICEAGTGWGAGCRGGDLGITSRAACAPSSSRFANGK